MTTDGDLSNYGTLAAALAKAQAAFPVISRDKEVTVQTKTGGSYKFKYAPLDAILTAVRGPLSDNGLAISQMLDGDDLVTMLLHKDGQTLTGRFPLPHGDTIQALGSAVTYLRRYSLQAILGIAAEEDDDGNRASGNTFRAKGDPVGEPQDGDSLIGEVVKGKPPCDLTLRQTPQGPVAGFKLKQGQSGLQVLAHGNLAAALQPFLAGLVDQRVSVWGSIEFVPWDKDGKTMPPYRRLNVSRIRTPDFDLPGNVPEAHSSDGPEDDLPEPPDDVALPGERPEAATAPLFEDVA